MKTPDQLSPGHRFRQRALGRADTIGAVHRAQPVERVIQRVLVVQLPQGIASRGAVINHLGIRDRLLLLRVQATADGAIDAARQQQRHKEDGTQPADRAFAERRSVRGTR